MISLALSNGSSKTDQATPLDVNCGAIMVHGSLKRKADLESRTRVGQASNPAFFGAG
jgi:hypothetical protein